MPEMTDDLNNPGPEDGKLISITEDHELDYWTKALNCSRDELRDAVAAVGHSADKVREYLDTDWQC
jgi:hypothetical protein